MAEGSVERTVWINSASGYLRSILRLFLGVISFRLLCTGLSAEEFGFYGLVWSFLGYGVLFDLGMGVTVQKRTAELVQREDWLELDRVLSSVLFCNCVCGAVIVAAGWFGTDSLLGVIGVSRANHDQFRWALRIFVVGMGAMFPLEMFREVHYGQQRIAFAEQVSAACGIVSFVSLFVALRFEWRLSVILGLQVACLIVAGIILVLSSLRAMPEVRLRLRYVSWAVIRSIAKFSTVVYISVIAGIVMLQMDRLMVGAIISVSAVATYHIGAKVSEIFTAFTRQLPESLAPAAAALHVAGHRASWQNLFLRGVRLNALITTPLFLLCALFLEGLLGLLTRNQVQGAEIVALGEVLLVFSYSTMLTHSVARAVFLMSGRESRLVRLLIAESLLNLASSFAFLQWLRSPIGAALGSLVPAVVIGWGFLWPWVAREVGTTPTKLVRQAIFPALRSAIPLVAFGVTCRFVPLLDFRKNVVVLLADAILAVVVAAVGTWRLALTADERALVVRKFSTMSMPLRRANRPKLQIADSGEI